MRVLAAVTAVLIIVSVREAVTIRRARAELQQLRIERDKIKAGVVTAWTAQPVVEVGEVLRGLNTFYADSAEGFGRLGGLCHDGKLDERPLLDYLFGSYLPARASGQSVEVALRVMNTAIIESDAYRLIHPDLAAAKRPN
ncbi:MAG: hypothetical protein ABI051_14335 [Vicinamibacterales bacterium]